MLSTSDQNLSRLSLTIRGAVQGVGFRPFVYRLATQLNLKGWVNNSVGGVFIEVEGCSESLERFQQRLQIEKPPISHIHSLEAVWLPLAGYSHFEIRASQSTIQGAKSAIVLPDLATCPQCLQDIFDPHNRRFRYPFTNCTNCGPRYSIIKTLPYDRENTTMAAFPMCPNCDREYHHPGDRRFHAQPNACPVCGPILELWNHQGQVLANRHHALLQAAAAMGRGQIVAMKGLGGFQLLVDATNAAAVEQLRVRKHRPHKPFAVMYRSIQQIAQVCDISAAEEQWLRSPQAPIVLLSRLPGASALADNVAPGNPNLGVMLPYTPLHHLLMAELDFPIVATSGNFSNEPICTDQTEALHRLGKIADIFLVHNRPIARPVDDSVVRSVLGEQMVIRRARGYAPLPVTILDRDSHHTTPDSILSQSISNCQYPYILAVGGHLKNTIAIAVEKQVFISQYIGNLQSPQAFQAFKEAINSLSNIYDFKPDVIACDAHPDYISTQFAYQLAADIWQQEKRQVPVIPVQHHYAHVLAVMAEHQLSFPVLGVAWDGTGYGLDETIWGGEFLLINKIGFQRVGHWRNFPLPGGDKAVLEPRRLGLGLLYELWGEQLWDYLNKQKISLGNFPQLKLILQMLNRKVNTPRTSSVGRLFDAIAFLVGHRDNISFEGQAAMDLEFAIGDVITDEHYPINLHQSSGKIILDWEPMVKQVLKDFNNHVPVSLISAKFHNTLIEGIIMVSQKFPEVPLVLTGGCFQNRYLLEKTIQRLTSEGIIHYWSKQVPTNDGGLALGQVMAIIINNLIIN